MERCSVSKVHGLESLRTRVWSKRKKESMVECAWKGSMSKAGSCGPLASQSSLAAWEALSQRQGSSFLRDGTWGWLTVFTCMHTGTHTLPYTPKHSKIEGRRDGTVPSRSRYWCICFNSIAIKEGGKYVGKCKRGIILEETKDRKAVETGLCGACFALHWLVLDSCACNFCQSLLACLLSMCVAAGAAYTLKACSERGAAGRCVYSVRVSGGKGRCGQELGLVPFSWSA